MIFKEKSLDIIGRTKVEDKKVTVDVYLDGEQYSLEGIYSGTVLKNKLDGKGVFTCSKRDPEDDDYVEIKYDGKFSKGKIQGDGILHINTNGVYYQFEGKFCNGGLCGEGIETIETDDRIAIAEGHFENSVYSPSSAELFETLGEIDILCKYYLFDEVIDYISENNSQFPTSEKRPSKNDTQKFEYRKFTKKGKQDSIGLVKLHLFANQVFEYQLKGQTYVPDDEIDDVDRFITGNDVTLTAIFAEDDDHNTYALYYLDAVDIYDGDEFTVYALPVYCSYFYNVSGGATNVVVLLGSYIE